MTTHEKALEAAIDACVADLPNGGAEIDIQRAITAYLSALLPEDAAKLVERLWKLRYDNDPQLFQHEIATLEEATSLIQSQAAEIAADKARIAELVAERDLLQDILDSRPAINAALPDSYIKWSQAIYSGDAARALLNKEAKG